MSCEHFTRDSRIDNWQTHPPLQNPSEHITEPEDAMKIDLVPEPLPTGGCEKKMTTMDVFLRNFLPNLHQIKKLKQLPESSIASSPGMLICRQRSSALISLVNKEGAQVLETTLQHATAKFARIDGLPEQTHTSLERY